MRRVLHIIREEDLSLVISDVSGLNLSAGSDDEDTAQRDCKHVPSAAAVAVASINFLHPPSLHTLLKNMHDSASACENSTGLDFEEKGKYIVFGPLFRKLK